jgi:hypothetical protein
MRPKASAAEVIEAYQEAGSIRVAASKLGISRERVKVILWENGVSIERKRRQAREYEDKPCACGAPDCYVVRREDEDAHSFRGRKYASPLCRSSSESRSASGNTPGYREMPTVDKGDFLAALRRVYGPVMPAGADRVVRVTRIERGVFLQGGGS